MRTFPFVVNGTLAVIYGAAMYYDYLMTGVIINPLVPGNYFSKFAWLTFLNHWVQLVYHTLGTILAATARPGGHDCVLRSFFHKFGTIIAFPAGWTVVVLFWGLVFSNPEYLVTPEGKAFFEHVKFNHAIHTLPGPAMLLDFIAWRHPQPGFLTGVIGNLVFVAVYLVDLHYFHHVSGKWAYPILAQLNDGERIIFFAGCIVVFLGFLTAGRLINAALPHPAGQYGRVEKKKIR